MDRNTIRQFHNGHPPRIQWRSSNTQISVKWKWRTIEEWIKRELFVHRERIKEMPRSFFLKCWQQQHHENKRDLLLQPLFSTPPSANNSRITNELSFSQIQLIMIFSGRPPLSHPLLLYIWKTLLHSFSPDKMRHRKLVPGGRFVLVWKRSWFGC